MDHITSLAFDRSGNLFATGYTSSRDFPVKNTFQAQLRGEMDAFLVKLSISDWSLSFSTFVGGSSMDGAYAVAVDSSGNPIISGVTGSGDFMTTPRAFQGGRRGSVDAFVSKFNPEGRVLWSTYYGGSKENSDQYLGGSMTVDEAGRIWFTGMTSSSDLPVQNPYQAKFGGGDFDGFIASLSSDGSKLCYGSYAGGRGHDILEGLAASHGRVYASGVSASANVLQKRWQVQRGFAGGPLDAILVGLDAPVNASCR